MFIRRVIEALESHGVKYALVGGYAVALHGAVRGTVDVDLVIGLTRAQFDRAEQALAAIGLQPRLPVSAKEVFQFREEYIKNRNLTAWRFINPKNPLELVDILITEDIKQMKTVNKKALGTNIKVVSIPDLINMKKKAGRPQDIEDIKALEKLK